MPASDFIKALNVEVRVVSEKDGTVDYVASDATLDAYAEIVDPRGWKFTHFSKNAPFVDSHDYWSIDKLLGKVLTFEVKDGKLLERVQWAKDIQENKLAQLGWKMTTGGFLKAVSVGFASVKHAWSGSQAFADACASLGLDVATAAKCYRIFLEQEQLELSACIVGANPSALAKAFHEGCVKDGDLAGVGFSDDDMHFLKIVGKASDDPNTTELQRAMIAREMKRIGKRSISGDPGHGPGPDAGKRAAALEAERRAAIERESFLKQLTAVCGG